MSKSGKTIFDIISPTDRTFFPLLEQVAIGLRELDRNLGYLVSETSIENRKLLKLTGANLASRVRGNIRQIFSHLGKSFITPFDREDIHALGSTMGNVANLIYDATRGVELYRVGKMTNSIKQMSDLILQAVRYIESIISELQHLKNLNALTDLCIQIKRIESDADKLLNKSVSKLFEVEKEAVNVIKYMEILNTLESVADRREDVANVVENILIKNH